VAALGLLAYLPVPFFIVETWLGGILGGAAAGLLTVPICFVLAWLARQRPAYDRPGPDRPGAEWALLALISLNLVGLLLARTHWAAVMISAITLPPAIWVWIWGTFGLGRAKTLSMPVLFGGFALPWEQFLTGLDRPLQELSASMALHLLNLFGYGLKFWNSYTIYTEEFYVIVNETCSGMNMLVTLSMYALIFGWVTQRVVLNRLILFLAVPILAMLANGVRVAVIYLLGHYGGEEWALGFWHTGSAYLLFLPVFYLLYRIGRFLERRVAPR